LKIVTGTVKRGAESVLKTNNASVNKSSVSRQVGHYRPWRLF
jgi:hypothetical protein